MTDWLAHWRLDWRHRSFYGRAALAAVLLVLLAHGAFAQTAAQPPAAPASPPVAAPSQPPPADRPGFIHQLGVWWSEATSAVDKKIKGVGGNKTDDLKTKPDDAAKGAADATTGTPTPPRKRQKAQRPLAETW